MICVTLHHKTYEEIISTLEREDVEMAEIRLDLCRLSGEEIEDIFANSEIPLIATSRGNAGKLEKAIEAGARYADLEIDAPAEVSRRIQKLCTRCGTELIRSWHDGEGTPDDGMLQRMLARCFRYGADIAKIVTTAGGADDVRRVESLYSIVLEGVDSLEGKLVAFCMGDAGRESRVEALKRGAPFTYASTDDDDAAAPGQISLERMRSIVYGDFKTYRRSALRMPASKSFAQRAIIAAALAEGTSALSDYTPCGDSEAALEVARALGAKVSRDGGTVIIEGIGAGFGCLKDVGRLDAGESGLLARLLIPLCSVLSEKPVTVDGRGSLLRRPLSGAVNKLASFGVMLRALAPAKEVHVPVSVAGPMIPGTADVSGADGSQLISGLLMALPLCQGASRMFVGEPKSIPYMYITQDVLRRFGVKISTEMEGNAEMLELQDWSCCTGIDFSIPGAQRYKAADFSIEPDWSAAANFLVAGAVFGAVDIEGLDTTSLQADISIIDILVDAGAVVCETEGTPGTFGVRKAPLEAFEADLSNAPDLFPIASVLAAFCAGQSRLKGLERLGTKESDRAEGVIGMLEQMGVETAVEGDELLVQGEQLSSRLLGGRLLRGGRYSSHGDHRMVMALKTASLGADSPIIIDDTDCVAKSYPEFLKNFTI